MRLRLIATALTAATLAAPAFSAVFQTDMRAPQAPIGSTVPEVNSRFGLKAIVPHGWNILVHEDVRVPELISWNAHETFIQVLHRFSEVGAFDVEVDWNNQLIRFSPKGSVALTASPPAADPPVPAAVAQAAEPPPSTEVAPGPATASAPEPVVPSFILKEGESLKDALNAYLAANGWELRWNVSSKFVASAAKSYEAKSPESLLKTLLPPLGLVAKGYAPEGTPRYVEVSEVAATPK